MSDWKKTTVEECCEILDNQRIPLNSEERTQMKGNFPYYGANGVQGYINKFIFDDDLILIAEDGGYFEEFDKRPIAYKISGKSWVNNHAHILKAKKGYCQDFIFYSLVHKNILFFIQGGTRSKLNQSDLRQITLDLPTFKQQQKIAKILTTIDQAIDKTQALISKYERIKVGLMQDLLTCGIDENGVIRSEETHEFKDSKTVLEKVPTKWRVEKLGKLGDFYKGSTISKSNLSYEGEDCILYGELYTKYNIYSDKVFSKVPLEVVQDKKSISYGDILFASSGETHEEIGKNVAFMGQKSCYAGGDIIIFSNHKFNPIFLSLQLNSERIQKQKSILSQGSSVIHIYPKNLAQLIIPIPNKEEQDKIAKSFIKCDTSIEVLSNDLVKLKRIKKGLMQDLLTGKVRV